MAKVRIASFGLNEAFLYGKTQRDMEQTVLDRIDTVAGYHPDLIVLPEAFLKTGGDTEEPEWEEITRDTLSRLEERARDMHCYIAAPVYERMREHPELKYNTVFLIDRNGGIAGSYRKVHTVAEESETGRVMPGSGYPVFDTDFGRVGFQTCFDIGWREGWRILADKGAQLVIWTAAYDGGNLLETYAAYHMYYVVSSVRTDHARIIDMTGRTVAEGARWNGLAMAQVDLSAELFHIDRQFGKIDTIRRELGDRVLIRVFSEENVFTVESFSDEWPVERIKREYGLMNYREYHEEAEKIQKDWRKKYAGA